MRKAYSVTHEQGQIVIRLDGALTDRDALARVLDYFDFVSLQKGSLLDEDQAAALADDVDRAVWEQVRHRYTGE